jgi:hypothetical protein
VKAGSKPTNSSYDCRPYKTGNAESCSFSSPTATTYYVLLNAYAAYSGVTLAAAYTAGSTSTTAVLSNGVPVTDLSGASGSSQTWKITVPAGTASLAIGITGQTGTTGDADLYVRKGAAPTSTTYDCRPYKSGSTESCSFTAPSGDYYVTVKGYSAFTKVTLLGKY